MSRFFAVKFQVSGTVPDLSIPGFVRPRFLRVLLISVAAFAQASHATASVVSVGNASGQSQIAQGPAEAAVDMTPCRFSMTLSKDQWLQFNTPDLVFIAAKQLPETTNAPRLSQAQTSTGYEWNFEKPAKLSQPWFGVMCESANNLSALTTQKPPLDDAIELQLVRESNDLKCPATLTDHGWEPTLLAGDPQSFTFESLQSASSSGFVIGYHGKNPRQFSRITFCLMHNEQVLIGSAESGSSTSLAISAEGFEQIKTAVRSMAFE
ncbi:MULTISPECIES: hypothetical protein [Pseudomonas]|nr:MULTISPECIES: hypothetical protein [Pseudomonas]TFA83036.1 hypothetical protein F638_4314 [Pseudomonas sp. LAIL14HWK12:I2]SCZ36048.1 hypothetical protein SAMN03159313_4301 [Pseudomonas sp. NFIX46]SDB40533.1 hypothetical protein SAMN03097715_02984 [Pseudomonas putida]SFQ90081.1 hypothetical protein SAMN03159312_3983 [Pseudomonas sp. NFIX49]